MGCAPEEGRDTDDTATDTAEASDTADTSDTGGDTAADTGDTGDATVELIETDGVRAWADGAMATSCRAYLEPPRPYLYAGATSNGIYRIDPDGAGGDAALVATRRSTRTAT